MASAESTLNLGAYNLTAAAVTLGNPGVAGYEGHLISSGGRVTLASLARANANDTANSFEIGANSVVIASGILEGTGISWVFGSGKVIAGTIQNVTALTGRAVAWGCKDGGSNNATVEFAPRGNTGAMANAA